MLEGLRTEVFAPLPGADDDVDRALRWIDSERIEAAVDDRAQIAILKLIRSDGVHTRLFELLGRNGNVHPINLATVVEAPRVIVEAENRRSLIFRVVAADTFEES